MTSLPKRLRDSLAHEPMTLTFGPHGFFGYAVSSSPTEDIAKQRIMWWSNWEASPAPDRNTLLADIRSALLTHHDKWKSPYDTPEEPVFATIIALACGVEGEGREIKAWDKDVLVLPRRTIPSLPEWSTPSGKIILMGDAAHIMPPETGQGVSCAAEDAIAIGLLLGHYTDKEHDTSEAFRKTARAYEALRLKHISSLLHAARHAVKSKRSLSWWQEWVRDTVMGLYCLLPLWLNDWQYGYDVEADVAQYLAQEARH